MNYDFRKSLITNLLSIWFMFLFLMLFDAYEDTERNIIIIVICFLALMFYDYLRAHWSQNKKNRGK